MMHYCWYPNGRVGESHCWSIYTLTIFWKKLRFYSTGHQYGGSERLWLIFCKKKIKIKIWTIMFLNSCYKFYSWNIGHLHTQRINHRRNYIKTLTTRKLWFISYLGHTQKNQLKLYIVIYDPIVIMKHSGHEMVYDTGTK